MKKFFLGTMLLSLVCAMPIPTMAEVNINLGFALPPPIVVTAPPDVIVMPYTSDVYVAPDLTVDLYFWNGWWWRPWEGRWYRSHYYDRGWAYYNNVPSFYFDVDPGWRGYYRAHSWNGHQWNYQRIHNQRLKQNWKSWQNNRYWTKQKMGVQKYQPRSKQQTQQLRQQRQQQYQQRPEVQRHQQQRQQQRQHQQKQQKDGGERR